MRTGFSRCRGFSLVSAIFLVVVLASLGGYMATMNSIQHTTTALSLQASRAWFAARSGMEWAIFFVRTNDACPTIPTSFPVAGFAVEVTSCTPYPAVEGADNYNLFALELMATQGAFGQPDFVSRALRSTVLGP